MSCTRLAAQILKLKKRGYRIVTENVAHQGVNYARYHLTGEEKDGI